MSKPRYRWIGWLEVWIHVGGGDIFDRSFLRMNRRAQRSAS